MGSRVPLKELVAIARPSWPVVSTFDPADAGGRLQRGMIKRLGEGDIVWLGFATFACFVACGSGVQLETLCNTGQVSDLDAVTQRDESKQPLERLGGLVGTLDWFEEACFASQPEYRKEEL